MRFFLIAQLALCIAALAVAAAPIPYGQIDELVRRVSVKVEPNVGKKNAANAQACVEAYCKNNVPSADSATVFDNLHKSPSDSTPHYTTSVKDANGNYINGFTPGTTPDNGQKAPMHHVDASGNPTPQQQSVLNANGGKFPI
ncbi:hypothetical protein CBOM_00287 [Ceraceosorus bombacis]|uniref:Uncharacterized protein n=1 Tax=Ceraceosorus bombacis TaxID=401625 RepID=A0A0P1B961_9BASI|nr:hypothetical protein CBOM_00287 [Ceraceosorus bombacis]